MAYDQGMLPPGVLRALAESLGIDLSSRIAPRSLSAGLVERILSRWVSLRDYGARDSAVGAAHHHRHEEPGWVLWCSTVASKVAACPVDRRTVRDLGWGVSAVEAVHAIEYEASDYERTSRWRPSFSQVDVASARTYAARLRDGRAYRFGIDRLRVAMWQCAQDDPAFLRAIDVGGT